MLLLNQTEPPVDRTPVFSLLYIIIYFWHSKNIARQILGDESGGFHSASARRIYMEEAATARRAQVSRGKLITFCKGDQSLYFQYRIHWLQATYVPQFLSLSYV